MEARAVEKIIGVAAVLFFGFLAGSYIFFHNTASGFWDTMDDESRAYAPKNTATYAPPLAAAPDAAELTVEATTTDALILETASGTDDIIIPCTLTLEQVGDEGC